MLLDLPVDANQTRALERCMELEAAGESFFVADGPVVPFAGVPYPTRMAVARLADGSVWVWSPIALTDELRAEVDAIGPVRHLVSPNKIHHLFLGEWVEAYPEATMYAPPGLAKRRKDLSFDAELGDAPDERYASDIDQVVVRGSFVMDEVLFFHRPSRTCVVGDLVQRHSVERMKRWQKILMKLDGLVGPDGSTPREWRATFLRRDEARRAVRRALAWEPERLVIAHGECASSGAAEVLRNAFSWLDP